MKKISMLLILALFLLSCQPEEDGFTDLNLTVKTEIQDSKEKNDANRIRVKNIAALRKLPFPNTKNRKEVLVLGYYEPDDGGGGVFRWNFTSNEGDNGGTIISPEARGLGRWERIFDGALNVKWFGAKGDGVTDDTNVIVQAANIASLNRLDLLIPNTGNPYIYQDLNLPSNLVVRGEDSVLKINPSATSGVNWGLRIEGTSTTPIENIYFEGIVFDGNKENIPGDDSNGSPIATAQYINNLSFLECTFQNSHYLGLSLRDVNTCKVIRCDFKNTDCAIISQSLFINDLIVEGCSIDGHSFSEGIALYCMEGMSNVRILNNNISNKTNATGILLARPGSPNSVIVDFIVSGNTISNCATGIIVANGKKGVVHDNKIYDCGKGNGIEVCGDDISVFSNIIDTVLHWGITIKPLSNNIVANHNIIKNPDSATGSNFGFAQISGTKCDFSGNKLINLIGTESQISVEGESNTVINNTFVGDSTVAGNSNSIKVLTNSDHYIVSQEPIIISSPVDDYTTTDENYYEINSPYSFGFFPSDISLVNRSGYNVLLFDFPTTTSAANIENISLRKKETILTMRINYGGSYTLKNTGNIEWKEAGEVIQPSDVTYQLISTGSKWKEISRSVHTHYAR